MKVILTTLALGLFLNQGIGQNKLYTKLVKLESSINSEADEGQPILSQSGDTLFFFRESYSGNTGGKYSGQDIWYSRRENGQWNVAKNDWGKLNNGDNNAVIGVNTLGNRVFLVNSYSPPVRRNRGVAFSEMINGVWTDPTEVEILMEESTGFSGFFMHPDEDLLVISLSKKDQKEDLYVSVKETDSWSELIHLGNVINSDGFEIAPFLSANKDSLFFSSDKSGGLGEADIYVSKRLSDNWQEWSVPINLGKPVNSKAFDAYYFQQENKAWFSSNRDGNSNIYSIDISFQKPKDTDKLAVIEETEPVEEKEIKNEAPKNVPKEKLEENPEIEFKKESYSVYFAFDSDQLSKEAQNTLDTLIKDLNEQKELDVKMTLTGFSDSIGPKEYNQILSARRNSSVSQYLIANGVSEDKFEEIAKGEDKRDLQKSDSESRALQRRVDITLKTQ